MLKWGRGRIEETLQGMGKDLRVVKSDDRMRIDFLLSAANRVPSAKGRRNQIPYPCR